MRLGLSIAFVALVFVRPCQAGLDHFESSGSMTFAREGHAATLLTDGKVFVEGGDGSALISAELFDPTTGTWTLTGGTNSGRQWHSATLLNDGTVLVAGGNWNGFFSTPTAELFDPSIETWTAVGSLKETRTSHTATLLPS